MIKWRIVNFAHAIDCGCRCSVFSVMDFSKQANWIDWPNHKSNSEHFLSMSTAKWAKFIWKDSRRAADRKRKTEEEKEKKREIERDREEDEWKRNRWNRARAKERALRHNCPHDKHMWRYFAAALWYSDLEHMSNAKKFIRLLKFWLLQKNRVYWCELMGGKYPNESFSNDARRAASILLVCSGKNERCIGWLLLWYKSIRQFRQAHDSYPHHVCVFAFRVSQMFNTLIHVRQIKIDHDSKRSSPPSQTAR